MAELTTVVAPETALPRDGERAVLVGRAWRPDLEGPSVVTIRDGRVIDITSRAAPTVRDLLEQPDPAGFVRAVSGEDLGGLDALLANSDRTRRDPGRPWLLAPMDLQALKAAGVTFVRSLLERVIEEKARGNPALAEEIRRRLAQIIGTDLSTIVPGSPEAARVKEALVEKGAWSQYLEVGIGPDAEIFTKSQPMSAVGTGADIGILRSSSWNNPEPEIVLVVDSRGRTVGATLGNDVNLRDMEGRSALLLGKAKDNNGSCAIGPFIRLFDDGYGMDDVRRETVMLTVEGPDNFRLEGSSSMAQISRDPEDLVRAAIGPHHQYPDGFALFLGTMFAPVEDRDTPGQGFTHKPGDIVTIAAGRLGALVNRVGYADALEPWTFGAGHLMRNLAKRGLLSVSYTQ
ncbi:MAG: fumarylacetoacetate hydrolase family protein, partial [Rhodospirillaceae bacterium]|nr:fumarylacetoacetate hydrolase family protein [Rhodospirillaceae bacterium]